MKRRWLIVLSVVCLVSLSGPKPVPPPGRSPETTRLSAIQQFKAMPIAFEANAGQTDPAASFVARGQGYAMWATGEGPVLRLTRPQAKAMGATVRLRAVGGVIGKAPSPERLLPGKSNYFIGNDPSRWKTAVARYGRLRYDGVYPGIDLVLHGTQESLEYDFDVAPNTDPSQIAVAFEGAKALRIESTGDVTLTVPDGELSFRPPVAYQERNGAREIVPARYELAASNVLTFAVGDYDHSRRLVIDPVISYSTYLGGQHLSWGGLNPLDKAMAVAVDASGNAYLTGYTAAIDFPLAGTPYDSTCAGCYNSGVDAFVAKIDPSQSGAASLVFATYLGAMGNGSTLANDIAVDASGHVYVTGWTSGYDNAGTPQINEAFPTTPNAFQQNDGGDLGVSDAFMTKLSFDGSSLLYSTYLGGTNVDEGNGVTADDFGKAVVVGRAASPIFPEVLNGYQVANQGGFDAFVVKFDTTLSGAASLTYGTLLGGTTTDAAEAAAVDSAGYIYVTGDTQSTGSSFTKFPTVNGFQLTAPGGTHAFMAKINPAASGAASLLYSTFLASDGTETASAPDGGIAVDPGGMVYVTGTTYGAINQPFPTTAGAFKTTVANADAYVVKIDPSLVGASSLVAGTLLGGSFYDTGTDITIDAQWNPVVTGETQSSDFNITGCGVTKKSLSDAFVVVLDPSLSGLKFSTTIGGDGGDRGRGVGIGPNGEIYVAGSTDSLNFPTTANAFDQTSQSQCNGCGSDDAFLTVISSPLDVCLVPPVAAGQSVSTPEDTPKPIALAATDLGGNSAPPESLTWTIVTPPAHGLLDASSGSMTHGLGSAYSAPVTYTPAANYFGPDSFTFKVNDGTADSNIAAVTISISSVNDPPTANSQSVTTAEETPTSITLTGSDPEGGLLTFFIATNPTHGILSGSGASRTYTPGTNYFGPDSFTFYVNDSGNLSSTPATVSITVTNVNDSPVAAADSTTTTEDTPVTINVLGNDTDADNDSLNVTLASCNNGATIVVNPDHTVTVTPAANFAGTITCTYTATDGNGGTSSPAQITVTVTAVNDDPVANADSASTAEDTPVTVTVLANDSDADGDTLNVTPVSCDNGAGIVVNPDKTVTVTPAANFFGTIACSYTVDDGHGGTSTATLTVAVTAVNDNPIAMPDLASTDDNTSIVIPVLANDTDPDGDIVVLGLVGSCLQGTLTANPDGTVNYAPMPGFGGVDTCSYTVTDSNGGAASGQITITVTKVNDPPTLTDPGDQQTEEGTAVSLQLTATDPDNDSLTFTATGLPPGLSIDANGLITGTPDPGSAGSYTVTVTVSDGNGSASEEFTWVVTAPIQVGINQPPACSAAAPSLGSLWPADHRLVPVQIVGVADPDGDQPTITVTRILQDEPTNTFGDGATWIDGFGVGTSTAQIRAERTGTPKVPGDGRVYQIFFTAADVHGATCTGSVFVSVPHDQNTLTAVDSVIRYDSTVAGGQPINQP